MAVIRKDQLLVCAIEAFEKETGLKLKIARKEFKTKQNQMVDGLVELPNKAGRLAVEVKKWATHTNIGAIANQVKNLPMEGILVADYVNPNMAEKLRELEIPFIDTVGNAYINKPPLYVWVTGHKADIKNTEVNGGAKRVFDAAGLKVVFGFLCKPELVNATYREIAEQTDVALGTVGWVINGLNAAGFLQKKGKGRTLFNKKKLLDRWVEAYPEKLQPKLKVGEFVANDYGWWKALNVQNYNAYWGGEVAASKYTHHLTPKVITLYLPEDAEKKLFAKAKLQKKKDYVENNVVRIYRPFWTEKLIGTLQKINQTLPNTVPPILAYADLIATGDGRNLEIAKEIYEGYINKYIGEA